MNAALTLGIILGLVSLACWLAFRAGGSSAREDTAKAEAETIRKDVATRAKIEAEVQRLSESDLDGRLNKWMRRD